MNNKTTQKIIIFAGPNGAGKTTLAPETAAIQAARLMLVNEGNL